MTVSDDDIVNLFREHDDPFLGSAEVADWFGHTRQWAHNRLQQLHDEGRIKKKKSGSSSVIWWIERD
jgi:hypothetical protein